MALRTDPLPTGCLSLQVGSVGLALDHTPMPNPPPEAGSSGRVGRDLRRLSGPAKARTPPILTHLPTSSVTWSKSLGLSGPQSESLWANKGNSIHSGTRPVGGECGSAFQQLYNFRQVSRPLRALSSSPPGERCCLPCRVVAPLPSLPLSRMLVRLGWEVAGS